VVHLQVSEGVLQYVCGTYDQGITYCDLRAEVKNKIIGWVDRDFGLKGFGHPQKKPTEIWEDNTSCIMMSEKPTNRDRSRHVDVKEHYLRDLVRDGHVKLSNVQVLRMFRTF